MTQDEFNKLCRNYREGPQDEIEQEMHTRIMVVVLKVMQHRMGISDEVEWSPPREMLQYDYIATFLDGCNQRQLGLLKEDAEGVILEGVVPTLGGQFPEH
jgi:hypothetical protein